MSFLFRLSIASLAMLSITTSAQRLDTKPKTLGKATPNHLKSCRPKCSVFLNGNQNELSRVELIELKSAERTAA